MRRYGTPRAALPGAENDIPWRQRKLEKKTPAPASARAAARHRFSLSLFSVARRYVARCYAPGHISLRIIGNNHQRRQK